MFIDSRKQDMDAFHRYCVDVMGLRDSSADSYVSYVASVEAMLGHDINVIVSSDDEMRSAINALREQGAKKATSNLMSGLRAYYRFKNGASFSSQKGETSQRRGKRRCGELPFEFRCQLNDLEFRLQDKSDAFWRQVFQLGVAIIVLFPPLAISDGLMPIGRWLFIAALLTGFIGIVLMFPILQRPSRQLQEIYCHGQKLADGEEINLDVRPVLTTSKEKICQWFAAGFLLMTLLLLMSAIVVSTYSRRPRCCDFEYSTRVIQ